MNYNFHLNELYQRNENEIELRLLQLHHRKLKMEDEFQHLIELNEFWRVKLNLELEIS